MNGLDLYTAIQCVTSKFDITLKAGLLEDTAAVGSDGTGTQMEYVCNLNQRDPRCQ